MQPIRAININPSSAAWVADGRVHSDYSQGCLRHLIWKNYIPRPSTITPELMQMGAEGEDAYQKTLETEQEWPFHKELAFKSDFEGVQRSGRVDFISYHDGFRVIHECKTSQSKNTLYKIIRGHELNINHLAQLTYYLIYFEETRGKLVVRYHPKAETRIFRLKVESDGSLTVDGNPFRFDVYNQLQHQLMAAEVIKDQPKVERPVGKACLWCDYKDVCEKYDVKDVTIKQFLEGYNG